MRRAIEVAHGTAEHLQLTTDGVHAGEIKLRIGGSWAVVSLDALTSAMRSARSDLLSSGKGSAKPGIYAIGRKP